MPLPPEIMAARLRNELEACSRYLGVDICAEEGLERLPVAVEVVMNNVVGPALLGGRVVKRRHHRFTMIVGKDYPFEKPRVRWKTPVFHPNIMMPEDGGFVCIKQLDGWTFNSTLLSFIKSVESLLTNPNPANPFGTESCTAAAEYFNRNRVDAGPSIVRPRPRIVERCQRR